MPAIKPIETVAFGCRFRSRLEARWATIFENMALEWHYEHEGYETEYGWYLPDFWLPEINSFFEIKPDFPGPKSVESKKLLSLCYAKEAFGYFGVDLKGKTIPRGDEKRQYISVNHCADWDKAIQHEDLETGGQRCWHRPLFLNGGVVICPVCKCTMHDEMAKSLPGTYMCLGCLSYWKPIFVPVDGFELEARTVVLRHGEGPWAHLVEARPKIWETLLTAGLSARFEHGEQSCL